MAYPGRPCHLQVSLPASSSCVCVRVCVCVCARALENAACVWCRRKGGGDEGGGGVRGLRFGLDAACGQNLVVVLGGRV
jgi:hypothetical protein